MFLVSSCCCLDSIHWSQVLSREGRCSWNCADRRCSNYIWVINNLVAGSGATYIRGLMIFLQNNSLRNVSKIQLGTHAQGSRKDPAWYSTVFLNTLFQQGMSKCCCLSHKASNYRPHSLEFNYRQISNISCTSSQNLDVSRLVLNLSLCNILKPMATRRCSNYIWVINNFIAY